MVMRSWNISALKAQEASRLSCSPTNEEAAFDGSTEHSSRLTKRQEDERSVSSDSPSENDIEEGIYASIEHYYTLPLSVKPTSSSKSIRLEPPPPLPSRNRVTNSQRRVESVFDCANECLRKLHEVMKQLEEREQNERTVEFELAPPATPLLIQLEDHEDPFVHFDSIPVPNYPSPQAPSHNIIVSDYMQPVDQSNIAPEPIYAKIIKKPKPPKDVIATNVDCTLQYPKFVGYLY